jgi:hypothetical protein
MIKRAKSNQKASPQQSGGSVLFLDFDGVMHPDAVYASGPKKAPTIKMQVPGCHLFENAEFVESVLLGYPHVAIVLSTTWCLHYGLEFAARQLTPVLQTKIIGTTFDPEYPHFWRMAHWSRYGQIAADVERRKLTAWLAVDDDPGRWPDAERHHLLLTPSELGFACVKAQAEFRLRMAEVF